MTDVTRILNAIERGDAKATDELLPLVYEELRLLAAQKLADEPPGQTPPGHGAGARGVYPTGRKRTPELGRSRSFLLSGGRGDAADSG